MKPFTVDASSPVHADVALADKVRAVRERILAELRKIIVGQDAVIEETLVALFAGGHCLIVGVPGLAKTLLVQSLAQALDLKFQRIQFTPDLMPSDITGTDIIQEDPTSGRRDMVFMPGPVFANVLLADEINRTPPKTQAAMMEVMEERQVSVDGIARPLPDPFLVAATQNPIEHEGTYPLPEAQLDRFLLKLTVPLPTREEELGVVRNHHHGFDPRDLGAAGLTAVAGPAELAAAREAVKKVTVADGVLGYLVDLCRATRVTPSVELGASPRGATSLLNTAKAWAWLSGRDFVTPDDVKIMARPTLRHRLRLRPEAELEGVTPDAVLDTVLAGVPTPR
ncbi:MAG TPA: MoxR family ATPase [Gemmatimonadaceae bacterium]|nr:MoxR family ATPase [Gemmatimonadaceae bacterium]